MTWVRIDDTAPLHPKLLEAGPEAAWLWVCGLSFCNRSLTDGTIRKVFLPSLFPSGAWSVAKLEKLAARLCEVRLWHDEGDAYRVHQYEIQQEAALKEKVEARREYDRDRKAAERAAKKERAGTVRDNVRDSNGGRQGAAEQKVGVAYMSTDANSDRPVLAEHGIARNAAEGGCGESPANIDDRTRPVPDNVPDKRNLSPDPVPSRPVPTEERGPRARPSADLISALVSGTAQAFESMSLPAPKQTRVITWAGWHELAAWCESKARLDGGEPVAIAQTLVVRFLRDKRAKGEGYPLPFLAQNPGQYWEAA